MRDLLDFTIFNELMMSSLIFNTLISRKRCICPTKTFDFKELHSSNNVYRDIRLSLEADEVMQRAASLLHEP